MRVLVLGIGNVIFADEGVGVHFVREMERCFKFITNSVGTVSFVDGGTLASHLLPLMSECDHLIVVDCIDGDGVSVGDVFFFDFDNIPKKVNWSGSAHEIEMLQTLAMMDLMGDRPVTKILAVVPNRIEPMSFTLSREVLKACEVMQKQLLAHLNELGFDIEIINTPDFQKSADRWRERQFKD